jgi:hypothetical protein
MKKLLLINLFILSSFGLSFGQTGQVYSEQFDLDLDGTTGLYPWSYTFASVTVPTQLAASKPTASEYSMHLDNLGGSGVYDQGYGFQMHTWDAALDTVVNLTGQVSVTIRYKASAAFVLSVLLQDVNDHSTDFAFTGFTTIGDNAYHTATVTYDASTLKSYIASGPNPIVDESQIKAVQLSFQKGANPAVTNTDLTFDWFYLGNAAVTGVNKHFTTNANINVFPNPSTGKVIVDNNSSYEVTGVAVLNTSGVEVFNQAGNLSSVELSNLNKGMYFMKVETTGGSMMKKIVLQ